jgi:hypothetical protein
MVRRVRPLIALLALAALSCGGPREDEARRGSPPPADAAAITVDAARPRPPSADASHVAADAAVFPPGGGGTGWGSGPHAPPAPRGVSVRIEGLSASGGGLDPAAIERYLARKQPHLRVCYARDGSVTARFAIDTSGAIVDLALTGMPDDVTACIANVLGTLTFPEPKDSLRPEVTVTFVFENAR